MPVQRMQEAGSDRGPEPVPPSERGMGAPPQDATGTMLRDRIAGRRGPPLRSPQYSAPKARFRGGEAVHHRP